MLFGNGFCGGGVKGRMCCVDGGDIDDVVIGCDDEMDEGVV